MICTIMRLYILSRSYLSYFRNTTYILNGNYAARVKKEFTFFSNKFDIDSNMGNYEIEGDFLAHDFSITKNGSASCRNK